nr:amidase domain-containing protein [Gracilibacillus dipsosauri]
MNEMNVIKQYWMDNYRNGAYPLRQKMRIHQKYNKKIKQITVSGKQMIHYADQQKEKVVYELHTKYLIEDHDNLYHEEESDRRVALLKDNELLEDQRMENGPSITVVQSSRYANDQDIRFSYDRRAAVQYAERWWNSANPQYRYFESNDCTNYISQCLRAGGMPMHGMPNRSKGWWYTGENWSYSWSVANALRWYLSGSSNTKTLAEPVELLPGDVICYDFQGDGRWDHNTIVVAKDSQNMPLVNAHTNNSRHRYWTYEDSAAWTPNCQYRFFKIGSE